MNRKGAGSVSVVLGLLLIAAGVLGYLFWKTKHENGALKGEAEDLERRAEMAETAQKRLKPPRVAVVLPFLGFGHFEAMTRGANRAAAELAKEGINIRVIPQAPAKSEPSDLVLLVDSILPYLDGLALAPQVDSKLDETFKKAQEQKLPVVLIDRFLPGSEGQVLKQIASDPAAGGRLAAEQLLGLLDKEGKPAAKVVLLRFQKGVELAGKREQAFLDVLNKRIDEQKKAGKPTLTILSADRYAGLMLEPAMRTVQDLLQQFGGQQIDAIATSVVPSTVAVLNALRQQGMAGKVKVIGIDETPELIDELRKGDLHGLVIQDPFQIGYLGVWTLGQHLPGKDIQRKQKLLTVEQLVVTKENLDKPEVQAVLNPDKEKDRVIRPPN
jgi:ribose transport system substrate-binding protein